MFMRNELLNYYELWSKRRLIDGDSLQRNELRYTNSKVKGYLLLMLKLAMNCIYYEPKVKGNILKPGVKAQ